MAYMRGENYIWSDGHYVHFWIADGNDYCEESSGWGRDAEDNPIYLDDNGEVTASGVRVANRVLDEFVVMRFAELLEEGRFFEAAERALVGENFDGIDTVRGTQIKTLIEAIKVIKLSEDFNADKS